MVLEKIAHIFRRRREVYKPKETANMYSKNRKKIEISEEESLQHAYEVAEFFRKEERIPILLVGSLPEDGIIAHNNHEDVIRLLEKHGEDKIARALHEINIDIMPKKPVRINEKLLLPLRDIAKYGVTGEPRSERAHGAIVMDPKIMQKIRMAVQSEEGRKIVARAILEAVKREMETNMRINKDRIAAISHRVDEHINILTNPKQDPRAYRILLGMIKRWARQPLKY